MFLTAFPIFFAESIFPYRQLIELQLGSLAKEEKKLHVVVFLHCQALQLEFN